MTADSYMVIVAVVGTSFNSSNVVIAMVTRQFATGQPEFSVCSANMRAAFAVVGDF